MIKILFTGGGGAGNEALFRLLKGQYIVHFGDADVSAIDPNIPADRKHQLPWASDPRYVEEVCDLCKQLNIDLLIPSVDEELLQLAEKRDEFLPTQLLLPDKEFVETMLDKLHMVNALKEKGIPVPYSKTLADDFENVTFPCISKPRNGRGSRDVKILNSLNEALSLKSNRNSYADTILIQERVIGNEYTVQMIADSQGQLAAIVPIKVGLKRGITIRAVTELEPQVLTACQTIHNAIPTCGIYNIQLILTSDGKVLPFEINPRVSTTLCLAIAAGIDPISIFIKNSKRKELLAFTTGLQLSRHWTNFFLNGKENEIQHS